MEFSNAINSIVSGIFVGTFFVYSGSLLLGSKIEKTFRNVLFTLGIMIFSVASYLIVENSIKMMVVYLAVVSVYKGMFNKNISQCSIAALLSYLLLVIGELFFVILISVAQMTKVISSDIVFTGNTIANIIIALLATLIALLIARPARRVILKTRENNKFTLIFTFAILLMAICSLFYKISFTNYKLDESLMFNLFLIICISYIGIIIIKQRYDKVKLSEEYEKYVEYSKQSEKLVEQYSISQHENKNELIIIKSMVHKNNKELLEYLDEIISSKDNIDEAWIRNLRYLPFGGLKGIIHNKVSEMKSMDINVVLEISKAIEQTGLKNLNIKSNNQLSKIIGVFLDNAREAALSSENKEVVICIYKEEHNVIFEIANSYIGNVNIDKIYNVGNSTKGKNRGYGLSLVKSIVEENKIFKNIVKLEKEYFVQKLTVNCY